MRKRKNLLACAMLTVLSAGVVANAAIIQHNGANDPNTEGWTYGTTTGLNQTKGPLTNDAGSGKNAWYVNDASGSAIGGSGSDYGIYYQGFTSTQQTTLLTSNWTATVVLRMPNASTANSGAVLLDVNLGPSNRRFLAYFGTDASGNPLVDDNSLNPLATTSLGTGYHKYDLQYDKNTATVNLSIDGTLFYSNWAGIAGSNQNTNAFGQMQFGSGSGGGVGQGNYNLVQTAVPEPVSLSMLAVGGLLMLGRRKNTK
jgi:hypothetical protein